MGWHLVITEEMRALGLSGNDLMVFALIYGFSQNGQGCFFGSISYLCETCGISKSTALRTLQTLTNKGFIIKKESVENGVKLVSYKSGVKLTPVVSKSNGAGFNMTPNNKKEINEEDKSSSISNKGKRFDFLNALGEIGVSEPVARDWMEVRKGKKAANTETAFKSIEREIRKSGRTAEECITLAVENSWSGFKAEWLFSQQRPQRGKVSVLENNMAVAEELMRMNLNLENQ